MSNSLSVLSDLGGTKNILFQREKPIILKLKCNCNALNILQSSKFCKSIIKS